jgi:NADH-quinone oxidoreductase subunit A
MLESYLPILIILGTALIFGVVAVNLSWLLGPQRPTKEKVSTYESGMPPVRTAHERFSVKYYLVAMLFILFDIEIVFMYPWAVRYRELGMIGLFEMVIFLLILFAGYLYIIGRGALRWD